MRPSAYSVRFLPSWVAFSLKVLTGFMQHGTGSQGERLKIRTHTMSQRSEALLLALSRQGSAARACPARCSAFLAPIDARLRLVCCLFSVYRDCGTVFIRGTAGSVRPDILGNAVLRVVVQRRGVSGTLLSAAGVCC